MRRLLMLTSGFFLSTLFFTSIPAGVSALYYYILYFVLFFVFLLLRIIIKTKKISIVILGIMFGAIWFQLFQSVYVTTANEMSGQTVTISAVASDYSEPTSYGSTVFAWVTFDKASYKTRLYFKENIDVKPGDTIIGEFALHSTLPEGSRESAKYQSDFCFIMAIQKGEVTFRESQKTSLRDLPVILAHNLSLQIDTLFSPSVNGFAKALLLGNTDGLSYSDDTSLKISGIRHVAAVSGLHVSILFGLLVLLSGPEKKRTAIISIPVLFFMAAVAGFTPSVNRACIMCALMAISRSKLEDYDSLTGLAAACLIMFCLNPYIWKSVSFQLSVLSVSGIILFSKYILRALVRHIGVFRSRRFVYMVLYSFSASISVTIASMITTLPISALYFNSISLAGIFTNFLTLWIIPIIFIGIGISCFIYSVFALVPTIFVNFINIAITYVLTISRWISTFPFAAVYCNNVFITAWIVIIYSCLFLIFLQKGKQLYRKIAIILISLLAAIILSVLVPQMDELRVCVMDVGEGQCILLQSKGKNILIDCGGDKPEYAADEAAQMLLSQGIRTLNAVILTHFDSDHCAGLPLLLSRISVQSFYFPDIADNQFSDEIRAVSDGTIEWITKKTEFVFGNGKLTLLPSDNSEASNENCMCILLDTDNCDILITGDRGIKGEKRLLETYEIPDIDILVAGHHGSAGSTSAELLDQTQPEIVIISTSAYNSYGHPSEKLLERLKSFGCYVRRTDLEGTITIRR